MDGRNLRRAWLRGYRQGDVELVIARTTLSQEHAQHELEASKARTSAMQAEIAELHGRIEDFRRRENELASALDEVRERRDSLEREASGRAQSIVAAPNSGLRRSAPKACARSGSCSSRSSSCSASAPG